LARTTREASMCRRFSGGRSWGSRWRWQSRCGLTVRIALIIARVPAPFDDHSPQHPLHIIPRRPPMRTGNVSVFLVPPPVPTPGKLCRPRGRHRLRPQQGLSAHPILTVADHHFTRYPLTLVTTHLWDDLRMLPDTCQTAKAADCAQGDNCAVRPAQSNSRGRPACRYPEISH